MTADVTHCPAAPSLPVDQTARDMKRATSSEATQTQMGRKGVRSRAAGDPVEVPEPWREHDRLDPDGAGALDQHGHRPVTGRIVVARRRAAAASAGTEWPRGARPRAPPSTASASGPIGQTMSSDASPAAITSPPTPKRTAARGDRPSHAAASPDRGTAEIGLAESAGVEPGAMRAGQLAGKVGDGSDHRGPGLGRLCSRPAVVAARMEAKALVSCKVVMPRLRKTVSTRVPPIGCDMAKSRRAASVSWR